MSNSCSRYDVKSLIRYNYYYNELVRGIFYSRKRLHFQALPLSSLSHTPPKNPTPSSQSPLHNSPLYHHSTPLFPTIFIPIQFHNLHTSNSPQLYQSLLLYPSPDYLCKSHIPYLPKIPLPNQTPYPLHLL